VFKVDRDGNETVLHSFTGNDGQWPTSSLVLDAAGNLYGTTGSGGIHGAGVVFEISASGVESVLYNFTGGADASPVAGLVRDPAGNLYGTTVGAGGRGEVFQISHGVETVLYTFTGKTDEGYPFAGLVRDAAGNLYGTTYGGGDLSCQPPNTGIPGCGVVFKVSGGRETVLYTFTEGADGGNPYARLVLDGAGNLYGTTNSGGDLTCPNGGPGCGVVFKLSATGNETVLYTFRGGADGAHPIAGLVRDAGGSLYGATVNGGGAQRGGVLFSINAAVGKLLPSDFDGTIAPPVGEPNFLLSIGANAPGNSLSIFKFHADFTDPANSTLTGPTIIPVHSYNEACGGQGTCIPQKGTKQLLESTGDRLMYRLGACPDCRSGWR
jgi:uncharacterized repeat protein (TIGR03803 family)